MGELVFEVIVFNYQTNNGRDKEQRQMAAPARAVLDLEHILAFEGVFSRFTFMMKMCICSIFWKQSKFGPTCNSPSHYNPAPDSVSQFKGEKLFHFPVDVSVCLLL